MFSRERSADCAKVLILIVSITSCSSSSATRISTRSGVTVDVLLAVPDTEPKGVFLLFPGGPGLVWTPRGDLIRNFPVVPELFAEQGFVAAVVNAPSDQPRGFAGGRVFRSSNEHVEDARRAIEFLTRKWNKPVFLLGHSSGDASVTNMALALKDDRIKGIVLAAPGVGAIPRFKIQLEEITIPVLGIKHRDDNCSSFDLAFKQHSRFTKSPRVEFVEVLGGDQSLETGCGGGELDPGGKSFTHAFSGKEREVVKVITDWALGRPVAKRIGP